MQRHRHSGIFVDNGAAQLRWVGGRSQGGLSNSGVSDRVGDNIFSGYEGTGNSGNLSPYATVSVIIKH